MKLKGYVLKSKSGEEYLNASGTLTRNGKVWSSKSALTNAIHNMKPHVLKNLVIVEVYESHSSGNDAYEYYNEIKKRIEMKRKYGDSLYDLMINNKDEYRYYVSLYDFGRKHTNGSLSEIYDKTIELINSLNKKKNVDYVVKKFGFSYSFGFKDTDVLASLRMSIDHVINIFDVEEIKNDLS